MEWAHRLNIIVHICFGSIALLLGLITMVVPKGKGLHVKTGRWYVKTMVVVVVTGLFGVLVFKRSIFLLVVTILSGYTAWSGVRTLRLKGTRPFWYDYTVPLISLGIAGGYVYYLQRTGMFWAPVVTYSILGALLVVCLYDVLRAVMSVKVRKRLWLSEHIYKMTSSFIAITSAFTGTVFGDYKPYSQILPGLLGWIYIIGAMIYFARRKPTPALYLRGNQ